MNISPKTKTWIDSILHDNQIVCEHADFDRPWGGFYVLSEKTLSNFVQTFFPELSDKVHSNQPWSPKILFVAPHQRLSWQYHHRRSEIWRVIHGKVAVVRSSTNDQKPQEVLLMNDKIELGKGERHRLVGLDQWGIVAEIWQHSDPNHLSDENDIVRVQDDFGR